MATPSAASWRMILNSRWHSAGDSAEVGSSMIRMRASIDSALAISTSCCSPTRSEPMRASGSRSMPSRLQQRPGSRGARLAVDDQAGDQPLAAEEDVVGDAELGNQVEFLVDDGDAGGLGIADAGEADRLRRRRSTAPS